LVRAASNVSKIIVAATILDSFTVWKLVPAAKDFPDERARRIKENDYTFFNALNQFILMHLIDPVV